MDLYDYLICPAMMQWVVDGLPIARIIWYASREVNVTGDGLRWRAVRRCQASLVWTGLKLISSSQALVKYKPARTTIGPCRLQSSQFQTCSAQKLTTSSLWLVRIKSATVLLGWNWSHIVHFQAAPGRGLTGRRRELVWNCPLRAPGFHGWLRIFHCQHKPGPNLTGSTTRSA